MRNQDTKERLLQNSAMVEDAAYVLEGSGGSDVRQFASCSPPPPLATPVRQYASCSPPPPLATPVRQYAGCSPPPPLVADE